MGKDVFSTFDVARILAVDISTVADWIDGKKLPAYRTPGGHRRVRRTDLLKFLRTYRLPVAEELGRPRKVVLIVEDDKDFREAIRGLIGNRPDLVLYEAEDGFRAGKGVEALKPDVVILDLYLPGVDGFQVCRLIRQDPDLKNTRILAISGHDTAESRRRILEAGADVFLPKPLGLAEFPEIFRRLLDGQRHWR